MNYASLSAVFSIAGIIIICFLLFRNRQLRGKLLKVSGSAKTHEHRYSAIFNAAEDAIAVYDSKTEKIIDFNPQFFPGKIRGKPFNGLWRTVKGLLNHGPGVFIGVWRFTGKKQFKI
jgi:hypothetical protein